VFREVQKIELVFLTRRPTRIAAMSKWLLPKRPETIEQSLWGVPREDPRRLSPESVAATTVTNTAAAAKSAGRTARIRWSVLTMVMLAALGMTILRRAVLVLTMPESRMTEQT
jgi:hypothetical protein